MPRADLRQRLRRAGELAQATALALLVHIGFFGILLWGFEWPGEPMLQPRGPVMEARIVELDSLPAPEPEAQSESEPQAQPEPQSTPESEPEPEPESEPESEPEPQPDRRAQAEREQRLARERREAQRLARLREQRQQQLEALRREREAAERAREAEKERMAELEAQRKQQAAERQRELEAERRRQLLAAERRQRRQAERADLRARYRSAIQAVVQRSWRRPPTAQPGLSCKVRIHQIPGGDVVSASVVEPCDADQATRRSIRQAVMKAQPLPYRAYEDVFERVIEFNFIYQGDEA